MSPTAESLSPPQSNRRRILLPAACFAIVLAIVVVKNPIVPVIVLLDGVPAAVILVAAALVGTALLGLFRIEPISRAERLIYGTGMGLGTISTGAMLLGWAGLLQRWLWMILLAAAFAVGALAFLRQRRGADDPAADPNGKSSGRGAGAFHYAWLLICPAVALVILVACVPPGYLWAEEGNGYDVLEYHLQMPKEYLEAGRVFYAPHNVYASFPANAEMLYLLCMILHGGAIGAAITCKLLNAALAAMFVATAWMIGRRRSESAGVVAGISAASVGWITYLSGVAYVENAMLVFGLLSAAALLRAFETESRLAWRWCALAGLLAGFAFGCKYTAGPLIGAPLALGLFVAGRMNVWQRLVGVGVFLAVQAVAFAPWAIKNLAMTGNPVFPLANRMFEAYPPGWGQEEAQHFAESHAPGAEESTLRARTQSFDRLWGERDHRMGVLLPVLALLGALTAVERRLVLFSIVVLASQVLIWLFATHLFARFAVPLLIPLLVLASQVWLDQGLVRRVIAALLVAGVAVQTFWTGRLYYEHMVPDGRQFDLEGVPAFFTQGQGLGHEHLAVINEQLPEGAHVLMLGDAKAFYFRQPVDYFTPFNRIPFVERVRSGDTPAELVAWLAGNGHTHVLVNWGEIARLRRSRYGFPSEITPDLFARMAGGGLQQIAKIESTATEQVYATLYRVPSR